MCKNCVYFLGGVCLGNRDFQIIESRFSRFSIIELLYGICCRNISFDFITFRLLRFLKILLNILFNYNGRKKYHKFCCTFKAVYLTTHFVLVKKISSRHVSMKN